MAISKVVYGDSTLIDISEDTVTASDVTVGKTVHLPNGSQTTGTFNLTPEIATQESLISQIETSLSGKAGVFAGVPTPGTTPVLHNSSYYESVKGTSVASTGLSLTISVPGKYRVSCFGYNAYSVSTSFGYTSSIQLYKNGNPVGDSHVLDGRSCKEVSDDIDLSAGDVIEIYSCSVNDSYPTVVGGLTLCINWDNGF